MIVRIARTKGSGCVVVTSDREIRNAIERFDAVAVSAGEFNEILAALDGSYSDEGSENQEFNSARRGNPARLSKSDRRRNDKLKKLRL